MKKHIIKTRYLFHYSEWYILTKCGRDLPAYYNAPYLDKCKKCYPTVNK